MEYVTLGKTGLKIARIGFGGIPIQKTSAEDTVKLFDELVKYGINYIDTARGYSVSEEYIGEAIKGRRDKFILATKSMQKTREGIKADVEISLKNFGTDYIDLYQIHNPPPASLDDICSENGALYGLLDAKKEGKIGHIGITTHYIEVFERALEMPWVETIMFPYNIVETHGEELIKKCKEKNIGFVAMKPMCGGAVENGNLAMRFIAANENVTVVIPGMYCAKEVEINFNAVADKSPLSDAEKEEIAKIRKELGNNFCRRCNYCAPCTVGINIPNVFIFEGYFKRYGLEKWALDRYSAMPHKASECISCGVCEERCPYHLPIREMLKNAAEKMEK